MQQAFAILATVKASLDDERASIQQATKQVYKHLFDLCDEQMLSHFLWWSRQESNAYWQNWQVLLLEQHLTTAGPAWDLDSMIDAILRGEYELLTLNWNRESGQGQLTIRIWSYPFGGVGALTMFLKSSECQHIHTLEC